MSRRVAIYRYFPLFSPNNLTPFNWGSVHCNMHSRVNAKNTHKINSKMKGAVE